MKITVALYGIPRCTIVSAPSIERHLLQPLRAAGDVRVVHHLWRIHHVRNTRSGEDVPLAKDAYDWFQQFEGVIEPPERFEDSEQFKAWKAFGDDFADDFGSLRNLMHQLQSLKRVTALAKATDPDIVVFARPDLLYHDAVPLSACRLVARFPRVCVVPIWQWWGGRNDRFSICGKSAYEPYGNRFDRAIAHARNEDGPIHSESLVKFALYSAGIRTLAIPMTASRVRADGTIPEESFDSIATSTRWHLPCDRVNRLQCRVTRRISKLVFSDASWDKA